MTGGQQPLWNLVLGKKKFNWYPPPVGVQATAVEAWSWLSPGTYAYPQAVVRILSLYLLLCYLSEVNSNYLFLVRT